MCLHSQPIRNKKYESNQKNGGIIPTVHDLRTLWVPRKCGRCMECMKEKGRDWTIRLLEEIQDRKDGKFITLTFSNESIATLSATINWRLEKPLEGYTLDNAIATLAMRRFNERWRKKYKKALRHWTVTELGHQNTENIHLHGIVWTPESYDTLKNKWNYGYIWPRSDEEMKYTYVNGRTVSYITKYVSKIDKIHQTYKQITLCSPGIGAGYITRTSNAKLNKFNGAETKQTYTTTSGHEMKLPKYYRNKIYTDDEKEILWRLEMDKLTRWVNGNKISVADNDDDYYNALKNARRLSKELGYGTYQPDWKRQTYEHEKRKILIADRVEQVERKRGYTLWKPIDLDWWEY